ncbi:MAG: hypothetical protein JSW46_05155 [Gemmatimonadota bacterium]|nr:MAG: hypothetical protein JSW46_05155 [Gemmatimonadota bacterium]
MQMWASASSAGARILAAALVILLCACSDTTAPDLLLSFHKERFDEQGPSPTTTAEGGADRITVRGSLATPCLASPSEVIAEAERSGSDLELRVGWVPAGDCVPGVNTFVYEAVLGELGRGLYQLRVLHVLTGYAAYVTLEEDVQVG